VNEIPTLIHASLDLIASCWNLQTK